MGGAQDTDCSHPSVTLRRPAHSPAPPPTSLEHLLWEVHRTEPPRGPARRRRPVWPGRSPSAPRTTSADHVQAGARSSGRHLGSAWSTPEDQCRPGKALGWGAGRGRSDPFREEIRVHRRGDWPPAVCLVSAELRSRPRPAWFWGKGTELRKG